MNNLNMFAKLPDGFRILENQIDRKLTALTLTQAFADCKYPVPSLPMSHSSFMKFYYGISEKWIANAEKNGLVLTNEDYSAVMVLTPIDSTCQLNLDEFCQKLTELENKAVGDNLVGILNYIGKDEEDLKLRKNSVYIEAFAVQTPRQGQKLGSKLMRQLFVECDKQDRDIFLFTNTEKNVSIYSHFGFETLKEHSVEELNSKTWFMLRRAQQGNPM